MIDFILQVGIAITGATAVFLVSSRRPRVRMWGGLVGLCSQPFWFIASARAEQWGIFFLCAFYVWSWGRCIFNNFGEERS